MSRRLRWIAAGLAAAALVGWLALRHAGPPPTDEELIRAAFAEAARGASERKAGPVMQLVSERFRGEGLDRREVHQVVAGQLLRDAWASVAVTGDAIAVEGDRARATVDVLLVGARGKGKGLADLLPGEASAYRFRCGLEREPEGWRVVTAEWQPISLAQAIQGPPGH